LDGGLTNVPPKAVVRSPAKTEEVAVQDTSPGGEVGLLAHKEGDAVAVAVRDLAPGEVELAYLDSGARATVRVSSEVPLGHKVALMDLGEGQEVIEYGERIGLTRAPIAAGEHVHVHNLRSARWQPQN